MSKALKILINAEINLAKNKEGHVLPGHWCVYVQGKPIMSWRLGPYDITGPSYYDIFEPDDEGFEEFVEGGFESEEAARGWVIEQLVRTD